MNIVTGNHQWRSEGGGTGGTMSEGIGQSRGLQSHSGGSTADQDADSPNQPKSTLGPEHLSLSRCANCYNQRASSRAFQGGDGESSSSAEDSAPELDSESEAESSSSSSSCSEKDLSEVLEVPSAESGETAEPEPGGRDGDGPEEAGGTSESQEGKSETKGMTRRAPLVKSFSLPSSFTPHLSPLSLLPRPHTVVSTLNLQVLSQKHDDDDDDDIFHIVKQHPSEREGQKTEERNGGGIDNLLLPQPFQSQQMGSPWQQPTLQQHQLSYQHHQQQPHQLLHQHQQQQPRYFLPLSAQGQRLPAPLHTLPVLHPQTHLHALTPQPCCCHMHFPHLPY